LAQPVTLSWQRAPPEDKANKAAEELAGYENRLSGVEARLTLLTWMVGVVIAMLIPLLIKAFSH